MKLIMKTEFDNLRLNPRHRIDADNNGDKQVVKVYFDEQLIAKKVKIKKSIRFFGFENYQQFLIAEE